MGVVPAGGPSTINGVLYQLLWALVRLGSVRPLGRHVADGVLQEITLVLEPSDGGDQAAMLNGKRVVTQLKARSTGKSWSLQEVIREVLPDLYKSVNLDSPDDEYEFVTETRRGDWADVETFFRRLPMPPAAGDLRAALPNDTELAFRRALPKDGEGASPFWEHGPYSPRRLVQKVVEVLRHNTKVAREPLAETWLKAWHLLRGFRFCGGCRQELLQEDVDRWLVARVPSRDRLAKVRDALLLDLARQACAGNAVIRADEFLAANGLSGIPLTDWFALTRTTAANIEGKLRRKRLDLSEDTRPDLSVDLLKDWNDQAPILVLTGESGSGKTWHGCAALLLAAERGEVPVLVESRSHSDQDLEAAAKSFWNEVVGQEGIVGFGQLRARWRLLDPANAHKRVSILFDNVGDAHEVRRLVECDWEGWGVHVILTCPPDTGVAVRDLLGPRGQLVSIPSFSLQELHDFISDVVGIDWQSVPFDVRNTLRRPLLAKLFRDIFSGSTVGWQPRNEYELFERAWVHLRQRGAQLLDLDGIKLLAGDLLLKHARYPWTVGDLRRAGLDSNAIGRLIRAGWLRETADEGLEVWHDRLLNWTVAEGVAHELRHGESAAEVTKLVAQLLLAPVAKCGRSLAYVPMDVLWLVSDPKAPAPGLVKALQEAFEHALGNRAADVLYGNLIPTLGDRAVDILIERLRSTDDKARPSELNAILTGLAATRSHAIAAHGIQFLVDSSKRMQRLGVALLGICPDPKALKLLWTFHTQSVRDPIAHAIGSEGKWSVYAASFGALKACLRIDLTWLEEAIQNADPVIEPVHDLAYLVANLGDESLWLRTKPTLMAKVDREHQRSLATCLRVFRDISEIPWLEERVTEKADMLGPVAIQALAGMAPDRALALLPKFDEGDLYFSRTWAFSELLLRLPEETMAHVASRLRHHARPWRFALVLQDNEDLIDEGSFDWLLDQFAEQLTAAKNTPAPTEISGDLRSAILFVNAVCRPGLLERLRARRGSSLEANLRDWLVAAGPQQGRGREHDKHEGLAILAKIGGDGLNQVLDDWLSRGDWFAQIHAVGLAQRRLMPSTTEILVGLTKAAEPADEVQQKYIRGDAAAALACHQHWQPVFAYEIAEGLQGLKLVRDCAPVPEPALDDTALAEVLSVFRIPGPTREGAALGIGMSGRTDLKGELRSALSQAPPESGLALACLIALGDLGDDDPATVTAIVPMLPYHGLVATNALLAHQSEMADEALATEIDRHKDLELATILINRPRTRDRAAAAIRRLAEQDRGELILAMESLVLSARLGNEALQVISEIPGLFELAETIGYGPAGGMHVVGNKAAALRIVAQKNASAVIQATLSLLRDPTVRDGEELVRLVADLYPENAPIALLEVVGAHSSSLVVHAIGCELGRLQAGDVVLSWMTDPLTERRYAACRVASCLAIEARLTEALRIRIDDPDQNVAKAAKHALEQLRRAQVAEELVARIRAEADSVHLWTLVDALASVADPGIAPSPLPWAVAIGPYLSPALRIHVSKRIEERRKKLKTDWEREDRRSGE